MDMIVEMTYDNGKHIATYSLGSTNNIKIVKDFLQNLFDHENPERFFCDFKDCGCNYSTLEILERHREWHFKKPLVFESNTIIPKTCERCNKVWVEKHACKKSIGIELAKELEKLQ